MRRTEPGRDLEPDRKLPKRFLVRSPTATRVVREMRGDVSRSPRATFSLLRNDDQFTLSPGIDSLIRLSIHASSETLTCHGSSCTHRSELLAKHQPAALRIPELEVSERVSRRLGDRTRGVCYVPEEPARGRAWSAPGIAHARLLYSQRFANRIERTPVERRLVPC